MLIKNHRKVFKTNNNINNDKNNDNHILFNKLTFTYAFRK